MANKNFHSTMLAVMSLDGRLAHHVDDPIRWSSPEDKEQMHHLLHNGTDLAVIGRKTYELSGPALKDVPMLILTTSVTDVEEIEPKKWMINPNYSSLLEQVDKLAAKKVTLLGGTQAYSYFWENGWIDEIRLTIEPLVFGSGLPVFDFTGHDRKLNIIEKKLLNEQGSLLLRYQVLAA